MDFKIVTIILIIIFAIFLIIIQVCNYNKRVSVEKLMEKKLTQNNDYSGQYEKIYSDNNELKKIKHDISKHMDITSSSDFDLDINVLIKLIVIKKKEEAQKFNIFFEADVGKFNKNISEPEIVGLLSNILDNAIEACSRTKKKDKHIDLVIKDLTIYVTNDKSFEEKPVENNYLSAKEDKDSHGYGTEIINSIVKKYDGVLEMVDEGKKFKTFIRFN